MFDPKRILVPIDFSEYTEESLKEAIDIADKYKSKVYLLHVIEGIQQCAVDYCLPSEVVDSFESQSAKISAEKMQEKVSRITKAKAVEIEYDIKQGSPADVIVKEQKDKSIDLIIMASHGKSGIKKYMLGSVADKVANRATSPVLIVHS